MCIVEENKRSITVRMSHVRWNRLVALEQAYNVAKSVMKAKKQVEEAPAMTVNEAMAFIDTL